MNVMFCRDKVLSCMIACAIVVATFSFPALIQAQQEAPPPPEQPAPSQLSPEQLQQLVAPIALFPDALVAQILAAAAYPTQIVEAERFLEQNPNLKGKELADAVDQQDWDPSVKALTQFPSVLANMNKDLSWTSELGDANYNQQADVMNAIQYMRQKAQQAGNLRSTPQQTVTDQGGNIDIVPADPEVVYVPEYNPEFVYGYPVELWPGFYPWWGVGGPYISFGVGFGIGPFFGFGWGWHGWGFDWHHHGLIYGGRPYAFHSHAFYDRNAYFHGGYRGGAPFARGDRELRGYRAEGGGFRGPGGGSRGPAGGFRGPAERGGGRSFAPAPRPEGHVGAFGSVSRGGVSRGFSARGRSSFGGGGAQGRWKPAVVDTVGMAVEDAANLVIVRSCRNQSKQVNTRGGQNDVSRGSQSPTTSRAIFQAGDVCNSCSRSFGLAPFCHPAARTKDIRFGRRGLPRSRCSRRG